ncbi:MAG TPA: hypothetical protein VLW48_02960 [Candidatus Bathyarchaeia archaeon]|nr:hypothetical protein [Candidatus Bathyarchaeia archaeon]
MALLKSFPPGGKKQTPMPGPNSAAYKKIVAAKKKAKAASRKGGKNKAAKSGAAFSSLKSRQMLVERVKRQIWASVLRINDAIISLALAGNFNAAKALFDFAGVYSLPEPENENANVAPVAAAPTALGDAPDPVETFFRSIGVQPPDAQPQPGVVAAG